MGTYFLDSRSTTLEFFIWHLQPCRVCKWALNRKIHVTWIFRYDFFNVLLHDNVTLSFLQKAIKITKRAPLYIREVIGSYDSGILCKRLFRNLVSNNFSLHELVILQKIYFHKFCRSIPVLNSKKIFVKKVRHTEKNCSKPSF